jgi:diadenosine tetraphosphate (Ap4A) HIT family hydrolase
VEKKPCPFCDIDKEKTKIICSKRLTMVVLSNPRMVPGHLLVIPKRHIEKLSELSEDEKNELFETIIEFQEKILSKVSVGCDVRQNYRPFLKQSTLKVDHVHIHLIPRKFDDKIYRNSQNCEKDLFKKLDEKEIKKRKK